jgi:hypothetical protein
MSASDRIITYREMCDAVGIQTLQRGMNFELRAGVSVVLMSLRSNAPYADRVEDDGRTLVYEGHDCPRLKDGPDPKTSDQPEFTPSGNLTQNGLFHRAAQDYKSTKRNVSRVRVFQKLWSGVWTDNGVFCLIDSWLELSGNRQVFKFKLVLDAEQSVTEALESHEIEQTRIIPPEVKREVWARDRGQCTTCGAKDNLTLITSFRIQKGVHRLFLPISNYFVRDTTC